MKERPIIFSGESVRKILEGRKTQTRRVVKPQPRNHTQDYTDGDWICWTNGKCWLCDFPEVNSPYGKPGDRLWVREAWRIETWDQSGQEFSFQYEDTQTSPVKDLYYEMEESVLERWRDQCDEDCKKTGRVPDADGVYWLGRHVPTRWRNPMFMPRAASRLTLEVADVRIERLREISGRDVSAEGIDNGTSNPTMGKRWENMQRMAFAEHWDRINAKRGFPWESNPWVWAIEFKEVEPC